jgi:ERCC4-related helicase
VAVDPAHHFEAVETRHHHVEDDHVRALAGERGQRRDAIPRDLRVIARVPQVPRHDLADGRLVVDDQDPCESLTRDHHRTIAACSAVIARFDQSFSDL